MAVLPTRAAKDAFLQALELAADERAAFLDELARRDARLAAEVQGLLAAHEGRSAEALDGAGQAFQSILRSRSRAAGARLGDYELVEEVGEGAFGCVWRARQVSLDRFVALKLLRFGPLSGSREHERLRAEAESVARLDHPHIVPIHEVGEVDGHAYLSMKWIEGGALAARLGTPWAPRRAALLMVDVARAMHHAHQRGLLHRDLKPSNVLLDAAGAPHVADFGIAKRLDGVPGERASGALIGTPAYMAPEQADGGELTVATDVWALGCVLYELLAGRSAFGRGSVSETLQRVRHAEPAPLCELVPGVPKDLETIVAVCLRKEAARRYASASALADDLERWLEHEPIAARRTGAFERLQLFCRRSPLLATLIGIVSALIVLLAVVATWSSVELGARLRGQYLGQARATRLSGEAGARAEALELLARAAAIRRGDDLRDETIASLALSDVVRERTLPRPAGGDTRIWSDHAMRRVVVADGTSLLLLDAASGARLAELDAGHESNHVRWSPDDRWLLDKGWRREAGPPRERFVVWNGAAHAQHLVREEGIRGRSVDFDAGGTRLAYFSASGDLVVVDLASGAEAWRRPLSVACNVLSFDPSGQRLALCIDGEPDSVQFRDARDGALVDELVLDSQPYHLTWIGTEGDFALGTGDGRVRVHAAGQALPRLVLSGHAAEVVDALAAPGRGLLATYSWDETSRLWDLLTGHQIASLSARVLGFDPDGTRLATADARSWSLWRIEHGLAQRAVRAHSGKSPIAVALAPDGRTVASAGPDGVCVWDSTTPAPPRQVVRADVHGVAFVDGGRTLVFGGPEGLWALDLGGASGPRRVRPEPLVDLAVSADGAFVAAVSRETGRVFDARTFELARTLSGRGGLEYVSIAAGGARVAAGNWRGSGVHVWDAREGGPARELLAGQPNVTAALSPDGALLATASSACFELVRLADGASLIQIERQRAFGVVPGPVAWSPDGRRVAFGLSSQVVRVLDAHTLTTFGDLTSPLAAALVALSFAADGSRLAAASSVNLVQVWDLAAIERELDRRD
ncbi:MAG: protein kinase [Planctomycetes bacterium]|nr:protein kinase [Planctomycetota bacterium]